MPIRSSTLLLLSFTAACHVDACPIPGDTLLLDSFERSSGITRHVATTGDDDDDGSWQSPWRHVQHAVDNANPGDTVCVRGGSYNEVVTLRQGGTPDAGDLVLRSVPGETATIDGSGLDVPDGQWGLITLQDVSHVVVRGFEIANFTTSSTADVPIGLYVTGAGSSIRLLDNHIHDIRTTASGCAANAFGLKVDGTRASASINDLVIAGNELDHLVLGCSESLTLDGNVENWRVDGNIVHDTNNIGIAAIGFEGIAPEPALDQARDGIIVGNTVHTISSFGNPAYGNEYSADGIYVDGGTRIVIERNLVHHVDIGIEVASEHAGRSSSHVIVRSNLIHSGNSTGISIGGYDASVGGSEYVKIVGNTLMRNDGAETGSGEFQIQYHAGNNLFANNIVHAGPQGLLVNDWTGNSPAPASLDTNLYYADGANANWVWSGVEYTAFATYRTASAQDARSMAADPLFLDPSLADLRVSPMSPAVGAGDPLAPSVVGTLDHSGQPRVQGAGIDIGAYEQ